MKPRRPAQIAALTLRTMLLVLCAALAPAQAPPVDFRPALPRNETSYQPPEVALPTTPPIDTQALQPRSGPAFRIAFLAEQGGAPGAAWYRGLKQELLEDPALRRHLEQSDFSGIALRPCDGPEDMLQRMAREEFDLVFCPALVYVRSRLADGPLYRVLFQERRRGDRPDVRGGGLVRHRGVLFVRKDSPLDLATRGADPEQTGRLLSDTTLALSNSYDAAGAFYIRKRLWEDFARAEPDELLYLGKPDDVVKAVVSGLAPAGACEESVLAAVFDRIPRPYDDPEPLTEDGNRYLRFLTRTEWVQTDPVLLHQRHHPANGGSELGRAVARVVKYYHNADPQDLRPATGPSLEPGADSNYSQMVEDVRQAEERQW